MKKRSVKNTFVRPRQQLRFALLFLTLAMLTLGFAVVISLNAFRIQLMQLSIQSHLATESTEALGAALNATMTTFVGAGIVLTLITLAAGVTLSHRMFGPLVPIQKLIDQLKDGDYRARGSLRKSDEFQELMANLNELAEALEKRHGPGQPSEDQKT